MAAFANSKVQQTIDVQSAGNCVQWQVAATAPTPFATVLRHGALADTDSARTNGRVCQSVAVNAAHH